MLTPSDVDRIAANVKKRAADPNFRARIEQVVRDVSKTAAVIDEERRVPWQLLQEPFTL